jgi:hypothetical protein
MKLDVRISGDITVNFGPNSITMIKHIQTTKPHIGIDKVSILSSPFLDGLIFFSGQK